MIDIKTATKETVLLKRRLIAGRLKNKYPNAPKELINEVADILIKMDLSLSIIEQENDQLVKSIKTIVSYNE